MEQLPAGDGDVQRHCDGDQGVEDRQLGDLDQANAQHQPERKFPESRCFTKDVANEITAMSTAAAINSAVRHLPERPGPSPWRG